MQEMREQQLRELCGEDCREAQCRRPELFDNLIFLFSCPLIEVFGNISFLKVAARCHSQHTKYQSFTTPFSICVRNIRLWANSMQTHPQKYTDSTWHRSKSEKECWRRRCRWAKCEVCNRTGPWSLHAPSRCLVCFTFVLLSYGFNYCFCFMCIFYHILDCFIVFQLHQ